MSLTGSDLLTVNGGQLPRAISDESDAVFFAQLDTYLDAGYAAADAAGIPSNDDATRDPIAAAFAYAAAYDAKYQAMALLPSSVTFANKGSESYSAAQMNVFLAKSLEWRATFDALLADATAVEETDSVGWKRVRSLRAVSG